MTALSDILPLRSFGNITYILESFSLEKISLNVTVTNML